MVFFNQYGNVFGKSMKKYTLNVKFIHKHVKVILVGFEV